MEVSEDVRKKLPDIFGCFADRVTAKFQGQIGVVQMVDRVVKVRT